MYILYINLIKVGLKEIYRDKKLFFFILIFPLMFLFVFVILGRMLPASNYMTIHIDEFMFPGILIFALMGIGLYGTTAPLIDYRNNGIFKLFEAVNLNKTIFVLSLLTVRILIGIGQISLFLLIGIIMRYINFNNVLFVFFITIFILLVMVALGIVFGGIFNSSEIALAVLSFLSAPLLMISNVLIPLDLFSDSFKSIAQILPFAYMGDLLRSCMYSGYIHEYSYLRSLIVITTFFLMLIITAIKTFKFHNKI